MFCCEAINLEKEQPQKTYMLRGGDCVLVLSKDELVHSIQKNSIRVSNITLEGRDIKIIKPQINYKTKCVNKPNPEFFDKCYKEVLRQLRLRVGEHLYRFESHRGKSIYDIGVCYGGKVIKDIIRFRDLFIDFYNIDLGTWITYSYNALIFTNLPTMIYTLYFRLNEMSVAEISNC